MEKFWNQSLTRFFEFFKVLLHINVGDFLKNWTYEKINISVYWGVVSVLQMIKSLALRHAATFAVNPVLVVSQWLHRVSTVSLHPCIKRRARGWTDCKYRFSSLRSLALAVFKLSNSSLVVEKKLCIRVEMIVSVFLYFENLTMRFFLNNINLPFIFLRT